MFEKLVLDISHWQGDVDFRKLKEYGVWGVILKCGGAENGKFYVDKNFYTNYEKAKNVGLHIGCYWFTGIKFTPEVESVKFIEYIKELQFDLPIYLDFEVSTPQLKKQNTDWCVRFIENIYKLGRYFVGIYASDISGFKDRLNLTQLLHYSWWVARYNTTGAQYAKLNNHMWQFTSNGHIDGIKNDVDCNYCYRDFPTIIISGHYNGW